MKTSMIEDNRFTQRRLRLRIPKQFQQEPIISRLISDYQVTINIRAAILGANGRDDGWFDLELRGAAAHVQAAMEYINDLGLEVWPDSDQDGW